ncbi:unnamed protein product [Diabrotica balteata]|uniref:Endonuclease-reverse transcriptase n=1 Tax=Diabrotica balteata TaxID=107213 RepID=A0A9N9XEL3_DIABA|nr:unnamed protein product [Diabrotica balteata]
MTFSKKTQNVDNLIINNTTIERVTTYKYLGTWLTEDVDQTKEIRSRIEMARNTFIKLKKLLCNRNLNLEIRTRMLRCYVISTLQYGMEAWTIKQSEIKKLNSFEMWCYRRIHGISWTEKVTNIEVLQRTKKECEVIKTVKIRKIQYLGHIMRGEKYVLLRLSMQGKIQGKRNPGRRKISWLRNLREWFSNFSND